MFSSPARSSLPQPPAWPDLAPAPPAVAPHSVCSSAGGWNALPLDFPAVQSVGRLPEHGLLKPGTGRVVCSCSILLTWSESWWRGEPWDKLCSPGHRDYAHIACNIEAGCPGVRFNMLQAWKCGDVFVLRLMISVYLQRWGLDVGGIAEARAFDYHASVTSECVHTHLIYGTVMSSGLALVNICSKKKKKGRINNKNRFGDQGTIWQVHLPSIRPDSYSEYRAMICKEVKKAALEAAECSKSNFK